MRMSIARLGVHGALVVKEVTEAAWESDVGFFLLEKYTFTFTRTVHPASWCVKSNSKKWNCSLK